MQRSWLGSVCLVRASATNRTQGVLKLCHPLCLRRAAFDTVAVMGSLPGSAGQMHLLTPPWVVDCASVLCVFCCMLLSIEGCKAGACYIACFLWCRRAVPHSTACCCLWLCGSTVLFYAAAMMQLPDNELSAASASMQLPARFGDGAVSLFLPTHVLPLIPRVAARVMQCWSTRVCCAGACLHCMHT